MSVAISGLTELTASPASNDYFIILDVSDVTQAPTGTTKRISTANVFTSIVATSSLQVIGSLQVSGATTLASTLAVAGALSAGSYGIGGVTLLQVGGAYTLIDTPDSVHAIFLGSTADPVNYYDNTTHRFRDRSGGANFATFTSATASFGADVVVGGSASVAANLTVSGTLTATSLSLTNLTVTNASVGTLTVSGAASAASMTISGSFVSSVAGTPSNGILTATAATTGAKYIQLSSTGANMIGGVESSAGGQLFTGSSAYATVLGSVGATNLEFFTNNTKRLTIDSAGTVTIPGTLSLSTGSLSLTNLTVTNVATMNAAQTDGGTSASISNGGTFDITVPNGITFFVLQPTTGTLPVNNAMWIIRRDTTGVNNTIVANLTGGASTPVTSVNTTQIRVTNNLGSACVFNYGFLRIAV